MNHYDDTPDTTVYFRPIPAGSGPGISSTRCGCILPASCDGCDGVASEGNEQWAAICAVRDAWANGELTAREYYHRSAAVDYDGLPAPAAVRALAELAQRRGAA